MAPPRILLASLLHETNSFNRILTPLENFKGRFLLLNENDVRSKLTSSGTEMGGFLNACDTYSWHAEIAFAAAAGPSGPMVETDFSQLKTRLIEAASTKPDGVLLALHGAMITEKSDDPEGDIACALRAIIGPEVPMVITLDMHANLSPRLVEAADALCIYETYPHVDQAQTAERAAAILNDLLILPKSGKRLSKSIIMRPSMLDAADHGRTFPAGPMNIILERMNELKSEYNLLSAGITIGFPWADTERTGTAVVLYAEHDADIDLHIPAYELCNLLWKSHAETQLHFTSIEDAIADALTPGMVDKPLILADFADNPAGGAYGDSPNLLRAMIEANLKNAAYASICDPEVVRQAQAAGMGAVIDVAIGGKYAPEITPPLFLTVEVIRYHDGKILFNGPVLQGVTIDMGECVLLKHNDIEIIVSSRALAITDIEQFRAFGVEPSKKSVVTVKSRNHHRAAFEPIARKVMLVDAGGIASMQLDKIPYQNLTRPIWPLDHLSNPNTAITILEFCHDD